MKIDAIMPLNVGAIIEEFGYCVFDIDNSKKKSPNDPIVTQYNIVVMCYSGESTVEANMHTLTIRKGDCMNLVNMFFMRTLSMSNDFKARVLMCSRQFAMESVIGIPIEYVESMMSTPVINLSGTSEWLMLDNFFENLYLLQSERLLVKHNDVITSVYRSIIILLTQHKMRDEGGPLITQFSQADLFFRKFIDLVYENVENEHEVAYYAEKLHVNPKYLSEICKQKSGHKAKEVISAFLIAKIKRELLTSGKSVKTVAYDYGFADQSSMGKFFNKMTGMSPSEFKLKNL